MKTTSGSGFVDNGDRNYRELTANSELFDHVYVPWRVKLTSKVCHARE